jgi:class 3 adenylate cyclase/tetratricopeptide (TPR) repeat protein
MLLPGQVVRQKLPLQRGQYNPRIADPRTLGLRYRDLRQLQAETKTACFQALQEVELGGFEPPTCWARSGLAREPDGQAWASSMVQAAAMAAMIVCSACGAESAQGQRFCGSCGVLLAGQEGGRQRKTVTVVFCDVVGSTALGDSADPETVEAMLMRYFERMKAIVDRHGGTVEKFIGDAVVAVFGIPVAREDDGLRALRAAVEMRDALPDLDVPARIGVNTGEVVTSGYGTLVMGDAVNVAARLEQAAAPGEVLVGAPTLALSGDVADVEELEPLRLKGKAEPVAVFRLLAVGAARERAHGSRFVGRAGELSSLEQAWAGVLEDRSCELVTVVGEPGVGKSRLVAEFTAGIDALVVHGRCLSYGEGITYFPVIEVIRQLELAPDDPAGRSALDSLLGKSDAPTSAGEIAWAFRKLLEQAAPSVVVFDDAQWAEDTFLDLIDHVRQLSSGAALLVLCLARPELVERRPQWPVTVRLAPLSGKEVEALLPDAMPASLRGQIVHASGGNPLFVTEMVAMSAGSGEVVVPATLKALLAARLDQLERPDRGVLERGAVEGEVFHHGPVQALTGSQVRAQLSSLVHKELIRPDSGSLPREDAFRFCHLLVRDAAYEALPKALRADLHAGLADWLDEHADGVLERDEIVGYHLGQAARYLAELGHEAGGLAERAARRLAAAGRRAIDRMDYPTAVALMTRAAELLRPYRLDLALELELAWAMDETDEPDWREPAGIAEAAAERAEAAGDRSGAMFGRALALRFRTEAGETDANADEEEALLRAALPLEEALGNSRRLALLWELLGWTANSQMRNADIVTAAEQSLHYHRLAGDSPSRSPLAFGLINGPCPADEALRRIDELAAERPPGADDGARAVVLAMLGRFDEAWPLAEAASDRLREVAGDSLHEIHAFLFLIAMIEGDRERACRHNAKGIEVLSSSLEATYKSMLARDLCYLGRHDEAEPLLRQAQRVPPRASMRVVGPSVEALLLASRDEFEQAENHARRAVTAAETGTDSPWFRGWAYEDLASVLERAGRIDDARDAIERAVAIWERKRCLPCAQRARDWIDALGTPSVALSD